jgi:small subunit ribosomal protein S17
MTEARTFRKTREGIVISDKMDKTVVVKVEDRAAHGYYQSEEVQGT